MSAFSAARRAEVATRAGHRCEYCRLPTRGQVATFPIDHIVPRSAGGSHETGNLALTGPHCNAMKWTATSGIDPETDAEAPFFNPRRDDWTEHFRWAGGMAVGRTAIGRATVAALDLNHPSMVELRQLLHECGLFEELASER